MLKKIINSARIEMEIIPIDPLLIKSGQASVSGVDMAFVRTYRSSEKDEPFIPGSSLKGVIRSYAEKICRSLKDSPVPVCLPYLDPKDKAEKGEERQYSCGLLFEKFKKDKNLKTVPTPDVYSLSCPACRLFGSHCFIGRLATSDAYLTESFKAQGRPVFEIRDGVAIDRITGGTAGGAKYDLEVLTSGEFTTSLDIRNFERWQLGLIALVLRDMEEGLVRIGFGKSRGLGRFKARITRFGITYYHRKPDTLSGLHALCSDNDRQQYGFFEESKKNAFELPQAEPNGLRNEYDLTDSWKTALAPAVNDLIRYIETVSWPTDLEKYLEGGGHAVSAS
jgi:CRISPR-associated RAMP protein (TIGR02581 family)